MTTVVMTSEEARARVDSTIADLRTSVVEYLSGRDGSARLGDVLDALRRSGHADELVSRALAGMLSSGDLVLTPDRHVALVRATYDQMLEYGRRQMHGPPAVERRRRLRAAARRR